MRGTPTVKPSKQLYFALSQFEEVLKAYANRYEAEWRINAIQTAKRYIGEGLKDRAITRDLPWGIEVPIAGYEDKKIYVWIDAVLGYLTASRKWAKANHEDYLDFWSEEAVSYYVHGKDNIPFHNVILPALLRGIEIGGLPRKMISSEYVTIEGKKLSTSNNWAVWVSDLLEQYNPDVIRYALLANGPEKRDADFSYRELITVNNADLVGAYGNLINRTLVFLKKSYDGEIKSCKVAEALQQRIANLYIQVGVQIEKGEFKNALKLIFEEVRVTNKYFDEQKPWIVVKEDKEACYHILYQCVYSIINLANLLEPFLPYSSEKVKKIVGIRVSKWQEVKVPCGKLGEVAVLFERLDKIK